MQASEIAAPSCGIQLGLHLNDSVYTLFCKCTIHYVNTTRKF